MNIDLWEIEQAFIEELSMIIEYYFERKLDLWTQIIFLTTITLTTIIIFIYTSYKIFLF